MMGTGKLTAGLLLVLTGLALGGAELELELEPEFKIRGASHGNWWELGRTVHFRALSPAAARDLTGYRNRLAAGGTVGKAALPESWISITGKVFDSDEKKVAETTVDAGVFARDGWSWKPPRPGFYSVTFTAADKTGNLLALYENIGSPPGWTVNVPKLVVRRKKHQFAVLPGQPTERAGFGVCLSPGQSEESLHILPLVGFDFAHLLAVWWFEIEPNKGVFNWSTMDRTVSRLHQLGIRDFRAVIMGTPRWASSKPEAPGKTWWQDYFAAYAPAKMSDLSDFLTVLVRRYPDIGSWEPWGEPHFPGQSIRWRSSPEEYAALQKTAYETIKRLRPDSTVCMGGIGMRYLPFYRKLIELGAGNYFDVLPLHGRDTDPGPFNAINRRYGIGPKPWIQGEWHAILFKTAAEEMPSETALSHRMLLDLMVDFERRVSRIVVWGWGQGADREFYRHFHAYGERRVSIGGFFRRSPYYEPRLPLVVLRNFMDCFTGKITFKGSWAFEDGTQQAVLLESSAGQVLVGWQNGGKPVRLVSALAAAVTGNSIGLDWEGRKLKFDASFLMRPGMIYFFKHPELSVISGWKPFRSEVLPEKPVTLSTEVYGRYRDGRIFSPDLNVMDSDLLVWHPIDRYIPIDEHGRARPSRAGEKPGSGFAGRFSIGFSHDGMDLLVEVRDRTHVQDYPAHKLWEGDSIQFALDAVGKGRPEDRIEFIACLTDQGPLLWKHFAPMLVGDLPARYTDPPAEVKYGRIEIEKQPGRLVYKIHISRDDIYPLACQHGQPVRFSLLVNNNDGSGRPGYLEWASGIGNGKEPRNYGTVTIDVGNQKLAGQEDLRFKGKGRAELGPELAKVTAPAGAQAERLSTGQFPVTPGAACRLSFSARGNVDIRALVGLADRGGRTERLDIIPRRILNPSSWTDFEQTFIVPDGTEKIHLTVFSWKQQGFYEIRHFRLITGNDFP